MEKEITASTPLLDSKGMLISSGWARFPLFEYDRRKIKGGKLRTKEWDYYEITDSNNGYAIMATFSDLGYASLFVIGYIDYKLGKTVQVSSIKPLTLHRHGLGQSSNDDYGVSYFNKEMTISFVKKGEKRNILLTVPRLALPDGRVGLKADITLRQNDTDQSMNIASSWAEDRSCFYYNSKINPMEASGYIWRGDEKTALSDRSYGCLDWGRGKWTRENTWYWASLNGCVDNIPFAVNLGYGFSDRRNASENAIIYKSKVHKLGNVIFKIPDDYISSDWEFSEENKRIELRMHPVVNRHESDNFAIIKSEQNQVFGIFSGKITLDDGREIEIKDAYGFAEKVFNRW